MRTASMRRWTTDPASAEALTSGLIAALLGVGFATRKGPRSLLLIAVSGVIAARTIYVVRDYISWRQHQQLEPEPGDPDSTDSAPPH